jgi:hypothetical protein
MSLSCVRLPVTNAIAVPHVVKLRKLTLERCDLLTQDVHPAIEHVADGSVRFGFELVGGGAEVEKLDLVHRGPSLIFSGQHPMRHRELNRFENLTYEDFRRMAADESLSRHEKVGFPDAYRDGKEAAIFADVVAKLPALATPERTVLEIGPGCSALPVMLIENCRKMRSLLLLVDSPEMLAQLPSGEFIEKLPGRFPDEVSLQDRDGTIDVILVYSVLHYVVADGSLWPFLDRALHLLGSGGSLLLGDIPNVSKRRRFFTSEAGVAFHRSFAGDDSLPDLSPDNEAAKIDDAVLVDILRRTRELGVDAYLVPQPPELPMANRREDILIRKP